MNETEKSLISENKIDKSPSMQYYLFNQNKIITEIHNGYANIEKQIKADSTTTYNAFSITKTFTALSILQLEEKGLLDINKPIINYLPDFEYGNEITIKQILNHSAGIPNPIPLDWIHLENEHKSFNRNSFFADIFSKNNKTKSKPNDKYSYSNLGYVILGQLIEKISGLTYEQYVIENSIDKLSLEKNDLTFEIMDANKHATGYHKKMTFSNFILGFFINKSKFMNKTKGKWKSFNNFYVNGASYGGLIGTPTAFVKYVQEFLKEDSPIISKDIKRVLFQENNNNKNKKTGMCLSWFTGELNGQKYFAHAGGGGGYYCEIRIYPDLKLGSVVFFNRSGLSDERYLDKLDKIYIN